MHNVLDNTESVVHVLNGIIHATRFVTCRKLSVLSSDHFIALTNQCLQNSTFLFIVRKYSKADLEISLTMAQSQALYCFHRSLQLQC